MTAEDGKYSYDLSRGKPGRGGAEVIFVDLLENNTVQFHTRIPLISFSLIQTNGTTLTIFPGGGRRPAQQPHRHRVPDEDVLFERNPNYHLIDADGNQLPFLDALRHIFARVEATQAALFRAGQVDSMRIFQNRHAGTDSGYN